MIYIIRHGQTELNNRQVLQGRSDHPLNEKGIQQARETAKLLEGISFSAVYSSPLIRADRTAEIIAPEVITFFSDFVHNPVPSAVTHFPLKGKFSGILPCIGTDPPGICEVL